MKNEITLNWPPIIEFGAGKIQSLPGHLTDCKRVFILCDPPVRPGIDPQIEQLKSLGITVEISTDVVPEPSFEVLDRQLDPVRKFEPDAVVGIGGGSAMDLAKLIAVLFPGEQTAPDIIGIGNVQGRNVKLIAVTTTSGTGSEVTPIAVLTDLKEKLKKGAVSNYLVPDVAIVDPELTLSVPRPVTASTGMDAMTHCIEIYTNRFSHPIIENLVIEGVRLIAANLETAVTDGGNTKARTAMALGSLYGGMGIGPVNNAAVHALAYPLGGEFKLSHGVSNSVLLPFVMQFNLPSCMEKYARIAEAAGVPREGSLESMAKKGIRKIRQISEDCGIPSSIKVLDIPESAIPGMAEAAMKVKRLLDNNPRTVTLQDAEEIFRNAYEGRIL